MKCSESNCLEMSANEGINPIRGHMHDLSKSIAYTKTCAECGSEYTGEIPKFLADGAFAKILREGPGCCKKCTPAVDARREKQRQEEERAKELARRKERWLEKCPLIFRETVDTQLPHVARKHLSAIMSWKPDAGKGLLLMGPTARGKTRLLWLLAERLHLEGKRLQVLTAAQFTHQCGRAFSNNGEAEVWAERLCNLDVLMIDDLGKGRLTERTATELFALIDTRMGWRRPIVVSMNHDGASLAAALGDDIGEPLVRRLRESCDVINFE